MATVTITVTHPKLDAVAYEAIMAKSGWTAPLEHFGGEAVVVPPIGGWHSADGIELVTEVRVWQRATGDDGLLVADAFILIDGNTLAPDLAYWVPARRPQLPRGRIEGLAPDVVAEILSDDTAANDLGPKRAIYRTAGVREYWIVDPDAQTVTVDVFGAKPRVLRGEDELTSAVLPGFAVRVAALFAGR